MDGKNKKKSAKSPVMESVSSEPEKEEDEASPSMEEYFKNAKQKLEQLMKGMEDDEFYEDLQDLEINSEDESDNEDEEYSDEKDESWRVLHLDWNAWPSSVEIYDFHGLIFLEMTFFVW